MIFSCWPFKWLQWAEFCLPFSQWEHYFRSLSSTALFIFMNLCHYAFTKLRGQEGNLADGRNVLSHPPHFFRKLSYLPNTNNFGCSHSHGECGLNPTKDEHQAVILRWPTVCYTILTTSDLSYLFYFPRTSSIHHANWHYRCFTNLELSYQKLQIQTTIN